MSDPSVEDIVALLEGMIASNRNPTGWEEKVGEFSRALIASWRERGDAIAIQNGVIVSGARKLNEAREALKDLLLELEGPVNDETEGRIERARDAIVIAALKDKP